jgi:hypothetical protein
VVFLEASAGVKVARWAERFFSTNPESFFSANPIFTEDTIPAIPLG